METLPILVRIPENGGATDVKGFFSSESIVGICQVPVDALRRNLDSIASSVLTLLDDIKEVGRFRLKEVTLQVEVTAQGGVQLIGTASLGGKGAITLKFTE